MTGAVRGGGAAGVDAGRVQRRRKAARRVTSVCGASVFPGTLLFVASFIVSFVDCLIVVSR
jgi:hypothetical protein